MEKIIQGVPVPAPGFGTFRLSGTACRTSVEHALALGYRHIDTAQMYRNESEVGAALQASGLDRSSIFLTTKIWIDNLAPARVQRSTAASLRRLRLDYVDLLLIHWPAPNMRLEQTLDAMLALQAEGHTRHIGVSNFPPSLLRRALAHTPLFCNQVEYHPFLSQQPLLDLAQQHDLLLTAYRPTANGLSMDDPTLQAIAEARGVTPMQVVLRWLLQHDPVVPIPKAAQADHRAANLDVFGFTLDDEERARIAGLAQGLRFVDPGFGPDWDG